MREFETGEEVFGSSGFRFGAQAEYVCLLEAARIARKPSSLPFQDGAAITDDGLNALWCYKVARLGTEHSILVYGASRAIGTAGVQLAKTRGANVTAVCNTRNSA